MSDHHSFGYKGGGVYACLCGHPLSEAGGGCISASVGQERIVDLKVAHLAHRLEIEPEALLEEVD